MGGLEGAFLAAIRTNFGDHTARLVYADWLDEYDDPRGEYLRLEARLATLKKGDQAWPGLITRFRSNCATVSSFKCTGIAAPFTSRASKEISTTKSLVGTRWRTPAGSSAPAGSSWPAPSARC